MKDRIRGSLIGGAAGDALGYPVEFMDAGSIRQRYGERGITRYETDRIWGGENRNGLAVISDDTQMTLFTACGLLNARKTGIDMLSGIREAYIEWYFTQTGEKRKGFDRCRISGIPELNVRRAPGNTCLSSLSRILSGHEVINNSKGCGGVMRIAPVALFGAAGNRMGIKETCRLAADASELTHQHPLGYITSAFVACIIYRLIQDEKPDREKFKGYVSEGLQMISEMYPKYSGHVNQFSGLVSKAVELSGSSISDLEAIAGNLGEGWTAEETAAIAIYCALRHFDNFEEALTASVNHSGDSDSTGAVTGNILGAAIGYESIPQFYKDKLELHDVILHIADDLHNGDETGCIL